jgi:cytochrome c biogenesis protein CcmG, thiol:disulfide interchange protein DsbE
MRRGFIFNLFGILLLMAVLVFFPACTRTSTEDSPVGKKAPAFSVRNLDGTSFSSADAKGKTMVINFWSTTCPPCVDELPSFQQFQNSLVTNPNVILLMMDVNDDLSTLQNFIKSKKYTFKVLMDTNYMVAQVFSIRYTPTTIVIDRDNIIQLFKIGAFANYSDLQKQLNPYLPR